MALSSSHPRSAAPNLIEGTYECEVNPDEATYMLVQQEVWLEEPTMDCMHVAPEMSLTMLLLPLPLPDLSEKKWGCFALCGRS